MFILLLTSIVPNILCHTKCVSLNNQKCEVQPTLLNLHPNEYSQKLHYYLFTVKLESVGSFITLNDLSNKGCGPNKTKDLNLSVFNMITGINELKTLTKYIAYKFLCKFQIKSGITINVDVSVKNIIHVKKTIFAILLHAVAKMDK